MSAVRFQNVSKRYGDTVAVRDVSFDIPSGTLVTLNFTAIGRGITVVSLPGLTVRNSQGQPMPAGSPQLTVSVR